MVQVWAAASPAAQIETMAYARARGAVVLVAAGGSTERPYAVVSGEAYGTAAATFAVANRLDGVVFDLGTCQISWDISTMMDFHD